MSGIIRVFPRRTNMTPVDDMAFIGFPGLWRPEADEVHVSCTFTWDRDRCEKLAEAWGAHYPTVKLGGPAYGHPGGPFIPGKYLKKGVVITSRGCPNKCAHCYVPKREGDLVEMVRVPTGNIIQDNNLLACSEEHFSAVMDMLATQCSIEFPGGLEAARLTDWHVNKLAAIQRHIKQIFLAYDRPAQLGPLRIAAGKLAAAGFKRDKIRCYVLMGQPGDTVKNAWERVTKAWGAGCLPFAMFYRDDSGKCRPDPEWRDMVRTCTRPAALKAVLA